MSKKLEKLKPASAYEDVVFYGRGDIDNLINDMANALNAAIDRINDLEQLITSHDHQHPYAGILDQLKNAAPEPKKGEHGE